MSSAPHAQSNTHTWSLSPWCLGVFRVLLASLPTICRGIKVRLNESTLINAFLWSQSSYHYICGVVDIAVPSSESACVFQGEGGPEGKRGLAGEVGNKGTKVMSSESITPIHTPCTLTQFTSPQTNSSPSCLDMCRGTTDYQGQEAYPVPQENQEETWVQPCVLVCLDCFLQMLQNFPHFQVTSLKKR